MLCQPVLRRPAGPRRRRRRPAPSHRAARVRPGPVPRHPLARCSRCGGWRRDPGEGTPRRLWRRGARYRRARGSPPPLTAPPIQESSGQLTDRTRCARRRPRRCCAPRCRSAGCPSAPVTWPHCRSRWDERPPSRRRPGAVDTVLRPRSPPRRRGVSPAPPRRPRPRPTRHPRRPRLRPDRQPPPPRRLPRAGPLPPPDPHRPPGQIERARTGARAGARAHQRIHPQHERRPRP